MNKEELLESTLKDKNKSYRSLVQLCITKHNVKQMHKMGMLSAFLFNQRIEDLNKELKTEFDNHRRISVILNDLVTKN